MAATSTGWYYWDARAQLQESYDSAGVLKTVTSVLGGQQTYLYSDSTTPASVAPAAGLLIRVEDQFFVWYCFPGPFMHRLRKSIVYRA
jgi:hypothetical protein